MNTYKVRIEGTSPLLQHRFSMDGGRKPRTGEPNWQDEAERALYQDENKAIYQPAEHLEGALRNAALNFKVQGKRGSSYTKLVGSTVTIKPDAIPHIFQDWKVDARPVVVQRARIIRYRPRFDRWALEFSLIAEDDQLPSDMLKTILDYAGNYVGIGDYRPATRGGKYGKFMVTKFETA